MRHLRFEQVIENKRGRLPFINAILKDGSTAELHRDRSPNSPFAAHLFLGERSLSFIMECDEGGLILPIDVKTPSNSTTSRFLAKMALEAMVLRVKEFPNWQNDFVDHEGLDPLRNHARLGTTPDWPFNVRELYDQNRVFTGEDGRLQQTIHEHDFLVTPEGEYYFVVVIFGFEFAINMAGPSIEGFERWLKNNDHSSPLYIGKDPSLRP